MASPSPSAIESIRSHVTDWTQPLTAILAALNAPSVPNPAPQPTVAKKYTVLDLIGAVGATRRSALPSFLDAIRPDFDRQDGTALVGWAMALEATGVLAPADVDAVTLVVTATQPDPAYQSQISWAQATLGRPADLADLIAAKP